MSEVWQATENVVELMREVKEEHHPELDEATIDVVFKDSMPKKDGRAQLGKVRKVSSVYQALVEADFIITLNYEAWQKLTPDKRRALLDHQLCHCQPKIDDMGMVEGWKTRKHDFEEFAEVIDRHGPWDRQVQVAGNVILKQKHLFQSGVTAKE